MECPFYRVGFCESRTDFPDPLPQAQEPSFVLSFISLRRVVDEDLMSVVQENTLCNFTRFCPRSRFPAASIDLAPCLAHAGLNEPMIEHLLQCIQSIAMSIGEGRDSEPIINLRMWLVGLVAMEDVELDVTDEMTEEDAEFLAEQREESGFEQLIAAVSTLTMQEEGVSKKMVPASLESIKALEDKVLGEDESGDCCVICSEKFQRVVKVMPCRHYYHQDCILQWLNTSHVCPLCRFQLPRRSTD